MAVRLSRLSQGVKYSSSTKSFVLSDLLMRLLERLMQQDSLHVQMTISGYGMYWMILERVLSLSCEVISTLTKATSV